MTQMRQPQGVPVGGQFVTSPHPESDVTLDGYKPGTEGKMRDLASPWATEIGGDPYLQEFSQFGRSSPEGAAAWNALVNEERAHGTSEAAATEFEELCMVADYVQAQVDETVIRRKAQGVLDYEEEFDPSPAMRQFPNNGSVTPNGMQAWRDTLTEWESQDFDTDWERAGEFRDLVEVVECMEKRGTQHGVALTQDRFVEGTGVVFPTPVHASLAWDDYRRTSDNALRADDSAGLLRPDEWVYRHGHRHGATHVPAPPVGTVVDCTRARSLPTGTVIEATFSYDPTDMSTHRLEACDDDRWDVEESDAYLMRRFRNLDTGGDVFVAGDDTTSSYLVGNVQYIRTATVTGHS